MQNDAKTLVGSNKCRNANEPDRCSENTPPALRVAEDEEKRDHEAENGVCDAHGTDEEYFGGVAVADGPADEVGVGLVAELGFDELDGGQEGGGMGCVLEGVEDGGAC